MNMNKHSDIPRGIKRLLKKLSAQEILVDE